MISRLGKFLVVCALVVSTGGHWFVLQSVAWFTMTVNFAHTDSLEDALRKTFDGKHPCRLCKTVEEGRQSEQKQATLQSEIKLEFCWQRSTVTLPQPPSEVHLTIPLSSSLTRVLTPPTPPPKVA